MATIRQRAGSGRWQVQIRQAGKPPVTETFDTKAQAVKWGKEKEKELKSAVKPMPNREQASLTLGDAINQTSYAPCWKYARKAILADPIASIAIVNLKKQDVADWIGRNPQLNSVTLRRMCNVPRMAWERARVVYELPFDETQNPFRKLGKLGLKKMNPHRERRVSAKEYETLVFNCYTLDEGPYRPEKMKGRDLHEIIDFAIETAMRRGELVKIKLTHLTEDNRFLLIPETKTDKPRKIPLSAKAQRIVRDRLSREACTKGGRLFPFLGDSVTSYFKEVCQKSGISDLRFHDLRHEGLTRLSDRGFTPFDIMTISGHTSIEMLKIYIQPDRERIYAKLQEAA